MMRILRARELRQHSVEIAICYLPDVFHVQRESKCYSKRFDCFAGLTRTWCYISSVVVMTRHCSTCCRKELQKTIRVFSIGDIDRMLLRCSSWQTFTFTPRCLRLFMSRSVEEWLRRWRLDSRQFVFGVARCRR